MPKLVDHDEWRAAALTRVFELFARKGYATVTVREVAQFLGVSTGKLYHYFPTKEALFEQMLRHLGHQDMLRFSEVMQRVEATERAKALTRFVEKNLEHFQNMLLVVVDYYRHHGPGSEILTWLARFYRDAVTQQLGVSHTAMAVPLFSAVLGMLLQHLVDPQMANVEAHVPLLAALTAAASPAVPGAGGMAAKASV